MSRTVGIVVPAYRPNVELLRAYVRDLADRLDPEAILIELDDPRADVRSRLETLPATVRAAPTRRGKGAGITAGFCTLDTDVRAFVDADGATAVDSVAAVVDRVRDGTADLAVGSRRHPDSDVVRTQSVARERLGDAFAWLARRLLSVAVSDYQCGAKAIDRDAWSAACPHLRERGFAWDVELVALVDALGYRVEEVPVTWADDPDSTVSSVGTTLELARGLVGVAHRANRLEGDRMHRAIGRYVPESPTVVDVLGIDPNRQFAGDDE